MKFNGKRDIIEDYKNSQEYINYKLVFAFYDFDYALVYKDTDIYHFLKEKDNSKVIFEEHVKDNTFVLFEL